MTEPACDAVSTFCSGDAEWTYTCQAPADHEPGLHDYQLDDGQPPLPTQEG
jgi:hypothetical protein